MWTEVGYREAAHGEGGGPEHPRLVLHVAEAELHAVPGPHRRHHRHVVRRHADLARHAAGPRHHHARSLRAGRVQVLVEPPHLPGLLHLLGHEAAAAQLGLGEVPGPGDGGLRVLGVVVPDVGDHLGLDGVDDLLPEDVGQDPAHHQDHEEQEDEHDVGQQETLHLLVSRCKGSNFKPSYNLIRRVYRDSRTWRGR